MKRIYISLFVMTILFMGILLLPVNAYGVTNMDGTQGQSYKIEIPNPLKNKIDNLPALLNWIIKEAIVPIGAIIAALMIMYAGFLYVTARGNPAKISEANKALLYAAIGTAILLGAQVLALAIQGTIKQIGG